MEGVAEGGAMADDLVEVELGADFFLEVEFLLGEFVLEFGDLAVGQGILDRKRYLTGDPNQEIKLILAVRIVLGSHQAQRAHNSIAT
jgi:hypothetical protein